MANTGESLVDQHFKDLKISDTLKSGIVAPDTSGWDVVGSTEIVADGKGRITDSLATTEGMRELEGGRTEFAGRNEHKSEMFRDGDDKNFIASAGESSKLQLKEKTVVGDEKSGRIETKSTSVVQSSSRVTSQQRSTKTMVLDGNNGIPIDFGNGIEIDIDPNLISHQQILEEFKNATGTNAAATTAMSNATSTSSSTIQQKLQQQQKEEEQQQHLEKSSSTSSTSSSTSSSTTSSTVIKKTVREVRQQTSEQVVRSSVQVSSSSMLSAEEQQQQLE